MRRMFRVGAVLLVGVGAGLPVLAEEPAPPAKVAVPRPDQKIIDAAVARGVDWLRGEQKRDGSFGTMAGETGLALLALRHSGVIRADRTCKRAAKRLVRELPDGTVYGASLGAVALMAQDNDLHQGEIRVLLDAVEKGQCRNGQWTYAYRPTARKKAGDNSNTQFAILALGAAKARRYEVSADTLRRTRRFFEDTQNADGGFGYSDKERSRSYGSMTAGAAMILTITADRTSKDVPPKDVQRCLDWLGEGFEPAANRGAAAAFGNNTKRRSDAFWRHYWLWSVERACSAVSAEKLGDHDWYSEGARWLLDRQNKDGSWRDPESSLRATCFALLFFGRSTKRVLTPRDKPVVTPRDSDSEPPPPDRREPSPPPPPPPK